MPSSSGKLANLKHLNIEPLDPNTNLEDINIDISNWEFGFEDYLAGHPQPSTSHVNAQVLASAEAHSRREKRVREEEFGESSPKRSRVYPGGADPDEVTRLTSITWEQHAAHLLEIGQSVRSSPLGVFTSLFLISWSENFCSLLMSGDERSYCCSKVPLRGFWSSREL